MISWCPFPLEVSTDLGLGYVLYTVNNQQFENNEWCVVLKETGEIKHFLSSQIKVATNFTYSIKKQ